MVDLKEECELATPPPAIQGSGPCGGVYIPSGSGCGHRLYVKSQANCSGCAAAYTQVFVSANGTSWTYAETLANSGSSITTSFIETYADYRYVLLGLPGVTFAQTPRWIKLWTDWAANCF